MTQTNKQTRYESIDLLKGIGIVIVVIGHCQFTQLSFLGNWIFAFHMPLFAFIGGLFFKNEPFKDLTLKRAKRLLIPFYIWSLFFWLLYLVVFYFTQPELLVDQFKRIIYIAAGSGQNSIGQYANVTLWFLPFLFTVSIIHYLTIRFAKGKYWQYVALVGICSLGEVCRLIGKPLPYSLDTAFTLYPFFWIGTHYFSIIKPLILSLKLPAKAIISTLLCVTYAICVIFNGGVDTASNIISNFALFYLGATAAIAILSIISEQIKSIRLFNFFGKHSLVILIFHLPILLVITKIYTRIGIAQNIFTDISLPLLALLLCVPFILIVSKLIPFSIGQK